MKQFTDRLLRHRRMLTGALHLALAAMALGGAFLLRFEFSLEAEYRTTPATALPIELAKLAVFRAFGLRDVAWPLPGVS